MNKAKLQKEHERFYLDKFLATMNIEVNSIVREEDPPDFYITLSGKRIAVEVTDFHTGKKGPSGQPRRVVEEEWSNIQNIIQENRTQYPKLNDVIGILSFKKLEVPRKAQQGKFVQELMEFSFANCEELTENDSEYCDFPERYPLLNCYLKELILKKTGCYIPLEWEWDYNCGWFGANKSELTKTISRKLLKLTDGDIFYG